MLQLLTFPFFKYGQVYDYFIQGHIQIHNQGTQNDGLTKNDYKGLFWIFITITIS